MTWLIILTILPLLVALGELLWILTIIILRRLYYVEKGSLQDLTFEKNVPTRLKRENVMWRHEAPEGGE